jgi:phenylacetic acid degradation operon negative regulatory protein
MIPQTLMDPTGFREPVGLAAKPMINARPQSLIFTLFGDYLHDREEGIRIGSLIKLLALFGPSAQVVRTTVSRMVARGWLRTERVCSASYYSTTPAAKKVIEEGIARIFRSNEQEPRWNGCWQLVTYSIPERRREARDRFRHELAWLGYGLLTNTVWLSPHNHRAQIEKLVDTLRIRHYVQLFDGRLDGFNAAGEVAARCWDLAEINAEYGAFIRKYEPGFHDCQNRHGASEEIGPAEFFVRRFRLVQEFRRFPYTDPYLPSELLPCDWLGLKAAALFREYHRLLAEGANRYFDSVTRSRAV